MFTVALIAAFVASRSFALPPLWRLEEIEPLGIFSKAVEVFSLFPLVELVRVDAATRTIAEIRGDLATVMMGTAVSPATGACAVTGTYGELELRFEPNVRGHVTETRVAIVPPSAARTLVGLNPQINYTLPTGTQAERDSALSMPTGVAWEGDGQRLYVTALGSSKLGVVSAAGADGGREGSVDYRCRLQRWPAASSSVVRSRRSSGQAQTTLA